MATSASNYPETRETISQLVKGLSADDREILRRPQVKVDHDRGLELHFDHNFHYQYSAMTTYRLGTGDRLRISSFHWGDAGYEKDMLELMYERLPHLRPEGK